MGCGKILFQSSSWIYILDGPRGVPLSRQIPEQRLLRQHAGTLPVLLRKKLFNKISRKWHPKTNLKTGSFDRTNEAQVYWSWLGSKTATAQIPWVTNPTKALQIFSVFHLGTPLQQPIRIPTLPSQPRPSSQSKRLSEMWQNPFPIQFLDLHTRWSFEPLPFMPRNS